MTKATIDPPSVLKEFGLTTNEIDIFLTLSRKGARSATRVAKETGLNRPYVYYALERLLEKGFISTVTIGGKKHFRSLAFRQIISSESHKLDMLKNILGELSLESKKDQGETDVELIKGAYAIKNILRRVVSDLTSREEVLIIGVDEHLMETVEPVYIQRYLNHFKKKGITERVLIKKGSAKLEYAKTTTYRYLAPELLGETARFIYQETVIDILYGTPVHAIIIASRNYADTARRQFEFFWRHAEKS